MRPKIFSLCRHFGLPSFFITLNPGDTYNPIVCQFAGHALNIAVDGPNPPPDLPSMARRCEIVASDPVAAVRFFDTFARAFITCLLGSSTDGVNSDTQPMGRHLL